MCAGTDHVLALDKYGNVFAWGNGQQHQLGRRVVERTRMNGLSPREIGLHKIKKIGAGSYHSFAIDEQGKIFSWGVNQYAQTGCYDEDDSLAGGALIPTPTQVKALDGLEVVQITGGEHHSAAITKDGTLLMWGRMDAAELGLDKSKIPADSFVKDVAGRERFLPVPTAIEGLKFNYIGCGTHHNVAIEKSEGAAYSWGYAEGFQVGLGPGVETVELPTKIVNTATKGIRMLWAGCGGQYSVMMGVEDPTLLETNGTDAEAPITNGVNGTS